MNGGGSLLPMDVGDIPELVIFFLAFAFLSLSFRTMGCGDVVLKPSRGVKCGFFWYCLYGYGTVRCGVHERKHVRVVKSMLCAVEDEGETFFNQKVRPTMSVVRCSTGFARKHFLYSTIEGYL